MKLGVWLPAVAAHLRFPTPDWERTADANELAMIALAADELGYDCVCAPEHVALPADRAEGTQYWDPLTTLGYLAAKTRRIRLVPLVVVLGFHHPLEIVKRYGTLDLISGGRVVLGVGVGGTEGEFALLGASFRDRGKRADDSIAAIRASLGVTMPAYEGTYYSFSGMVVDPTLRAGTPLWVGGGSHAALRRALRTGRGWAPTGLQPEDAGALLAELDPGQERDPEFEVVFLPRAEQVTDPIGDADLTPDMIPEPGRVEVVLADGRRRSAEATRTPGHPEHPLDDAALHAKFRSCARRLGSRGTEALLEALTHLDEVEDMRQVVRLTVPG